jgi:formamidopyrimidine-DNA glycosylase
VPELPEVETIVRGLSAAIVGERIVRAEVRLAKIAVAPPETNFIVAVSRRRIVGVGRRGKYAVIELDSRDRLVTSLRMTGRLVVLKRRDLDFPGTHVVLWLGGGRRLAFADVRTFGRMRLVPPSEAWDDGLGVEPLSSAFTPQAFLSMLAGRTTPIKALLLDQRRIAGIGNIYACEALWRARIRPSRAAGTLTKPSVLRLREAIVEVLGHAIAMRGSSVDDYVDAEGVAGGFQTALSVYGRRGQNCTRCSGPIVRTVLGQRGTWWCRRCQR